MTPVTESTGFAYDTCFTEHVLQPGHPESPERLKALIPYLREQGLLDRCRPVEPVEDPYPYISAVHSAEHIASVKSEPTTGRVAARAAAAVLGAVRDVCSGTLENAFCAVRPPGHHAHDNGAHYDGHGQGQGFCFYNNLAVGAAYARAAFGMEHILIVDWDFHHGNGTEWAFSGDEGILFCSTHNQQAYPGPYGVTGAANCIDVHFPCGCSGADIMQVWDEQLQPRLESFVPDLVMISAGFDSSEHDPLGCYAVTDKEYAEMTTVVREMARNACGGRLVSVLEGGYNPDAEARSIAAHLRALMA